MPDDSTPRAGGLAARIKAAIETRREQTRRAREAEQRRRDLSERARRELLRDLAEFGKAIGHFDVVAKRDRVSFRFEGRTLSFEASGDLDQVVVTGDGLKGVNALFIQEPLNKWVWTHKPPRGPERRMILFDQGLEAMIALVLKVKPAEAPDEPDPRPGETVKRSL